MARSRVYRHDIRCPHCGSNWCIKYGRANGKQTYRCNDCFHRFMPDSKRHTFPERIKRQAIRMYCEGMSIRGIGRALGVHYSTVFKWIKKTSLRALKIFERRKKELRNQRVSEVSIDEMWTYVKGRRGNKRNSVWIWTAVFDNGKMIFEVGDRSEETFLRLSEQMPLAERYYTDNYEVYNLLPSDLHETGKFGR